MCEFISWIEIKGRVKFLTGEQLFQTKKGKEFIKSISPDDFWGHGTIREWYGIDTRAGIDKECIDFSDPANFPLKIVLSLKGGKFKGFALPKGLLNESLDEKYTLDREPFNIKYGTDLELLDKKYGSDREPLYGKDAAGFKRLDEKYWADRRSLNIRHRVDLKPLDNKYWDLFTIPENRNLKWR